MNYEGWTWTAQSDGTSFYGEYDQYVDSPNVVLDTAPFSDLYRELELHFPDLDIIVSTGRYSAVDSVWAVQNYELDMDRGTLQVEPHSECKVTYSVHLQFEDADYCFADAREFAELRRAAGDTVQESKE